MNKNIETTKIKVNNFAEALVEMRKLKNSGEEWKLLEKHTKWTLGEGRKNKDSVSGFIFSNGEKKVDIVAEKSSYDLDEMDSIFGGKEHYQKLQEIFPEDKVPFLSRKNPVGHSISLKVIGELTKEHTTIMRLFNAWSFNDICKILVDYYQANKTEIDQTTEKNFPQLSKNEFTLSAPWLEVGDDDKLFYIWVGKRDLKKGFYRGGGELEVCLRKSDLVGKYDENGMKLDDFSGSAQKLKGRINVFWNILTDEYNSKFGNDVIIAHYNKNVQLGFDGNNPVGWLESGSYELPKKSGSKKPKPINSPVKSSNLDSDQYEEQVRRYMEQNDIFQLTLDNGKLIVEYNKTSKKEEKEINTEDLKAIQSYLKEHNNSINIEQLKSNSNSPTSQPDKPNYTLWISIGAEGIAAGIIVSYLLFGRKIKSKQK